jgi:transposase
MDSSRSIGIIVPAGVMWCECQRSQEEPVMNATTVAVDLAKNVYQLAVADGSWRVIQKHRLTRAQFERFFANREVKLVVMEACGSAHYWARQIQALGIEVRLLPPRYIRAYVKRNKTDAADAAALLEAARCADIVPVKVKSIEQQALQCLHRTRERWMRTRMARSNRNKAVCALANKMARLCFATLRDHEPYAAARLTRKLAQVSYSCAS